MPTSNTTPQPKPPVFELVSASEEFWEQSGTSPPTTAKSADQKPVALRLLRASDVEPSQVEWLWPSRIAFGKLNGLVGDPGIGKSTLSLDIAARLSAGLPMPFESGSIDPSDVIILSAEDGPGDTIRPRLEAAGAELTRVHIAELAIEPGGEEVGITLPDHLDALRDAVTRTGARLAIIDPLNAYLSGNLNSHRDQDVRRALAPFAVVAEETGCAILIICHLNKAQELEPLYRVGGSIGLVAAFRLVLFVAPDPDDEESAVLAQLKSNLGPPAEPLSYRLEAVPHSHVAGVTWTGRSHRSPAELLGQKGVNTRSQLEEATAFLEARLSGGPQRSTQVYEQANGSGISKRTLDRARKALDVRSKPLGFGGPHYMMLPGDQASFDNQESPDGSSLPEPACLAVSARRDLVTDCKETASPEIATVADPQATDHPRARQAGEHRDEPAAPSFRAPRQARVRHSEPDAESGREPNVATSICLGCGGPKPPTWTHTDFCGDCQLRRSKAIREETAGGAK